MLIFNNILTPVIIYNVTLMHEITYIFTHSQITSCIENDNIVHTYCVTYDQVQCAINKIKPEKSDCIDGMISDHLKNRTKKLNIYISLLFNCMLVHGTAPGGLLLSKLVPIPKNKRGNKSGSSNY